MDVEQNWTDELVLSEIGSRIARARLDKNLTQAEVTTEAGVGLKTLQRLEAGQSGTQLTSFIRILRVLGLLERLNVFLPPTVESPIAKLKLKHKNKQRQRASKANTVSKDQTEWTWGE